LDAPALPVRSLISTLNPQFSYGIENGDLVSDSETDSDEGEKEVEKGVEKGAMKENGKEVEVERKVEEVEKGVKRGVEMEKEGVEEVEKGVKEKMERGVREEVIRYEKSMMSEDKRKEEGWEDERKLKKSSEKVDEEKVEIEELKEEKEEEDEKETEGDESINIISELKEKFKDYSNSNVKMVGKKLLKIKKIIPESPIQGPWKSAESRTNSVNSSTEFISSIYDNSLLSPPRHPSLPRSLPQSPPLSLSQSLSFPTTSLLSFTPNMFDSPPMKSVRSSEFGSNGNDISRNIDTENDDFDEFSQFLDKSKNGNDDDEIKGEEGDGKVDDNKEENEKDGEIVNKKVKDGNGEKRGAEEEGKARSDEKDGSERNEGKEGKEERGGKEGRERRGSREGAVDGMTECLVMLQKKLKQLQKR
jgi:hypothetical protein